MNMYLNQLLVYFLLQYEVFAERTIASSEDYMKNLILAFDDMSNQVTSAGVHSELGFPFVTIPYFEVAGYHARVISGVLGFVYCPLVLTRDVDQWKQYSTQNSHWIDQGREYLRSLPPREDGTVVVEIGDETSNQITPFIWRQDALLNPVIADPPPHAPVWLSSPPPANTQFVNYDMLKEIEFGAAFEAILVKRGKGFVRGL